MLGGASSAATLLLLSTIDLLFHRLGSAVMHLMTAVRAMLAWPLQKSPPLLESAQIADCEAPPESPPAESGASAANRRTRRQVTILSDKPEVQACIKDIVHSCECQECRRRSRAIGDVRNTARLEPHVDDPLVLKAMGRRLVPLRRLLPSGSAIVV